MATVAIDVTVTEPPSADFAYESILAIDQIFNNGGFLNFGIDSPRSLAENPSLVVGGSVYVTGTGVGYIDDTIHIISAINSATQLTFTTIYVSGVGLVSGQMRLFPEHIELQ